MFSFLPNYGFKFIFTYWPRLSGSTSYIRNPSALRNQMQTNVHHLSSSASNQQKTVFVVHVWTEIQESGPGISWHELSVLLTLTVLEYVAFLKFGQFEEIKRVRLEHGLINQFSSTCPKLFKVQFFSSTTPIVVATIQTCRCRDMSHRLYFEPVHSVIK